MYRIYSLKNGIRVVVENIDYVRSVSVGVWIGAGSAMETVENNGVSHFIEHMLFKGTENRSAKEIAECMDRVGGQLNAVTAKEYTCYYAKTLTEHSQLAIDVLSDMVTNSTFTEENIATERKVIAEEINMCEDTPEDFIHDILSSTLWGDSPLGFPIAGTLETLKGIDRKVMLDYRDREYKAENIVISVVGHFEESDILKMLEEKFGEIKASGNEKYSQAEILVSRRTKLVKKDIEQCHLCLGLGGISRTDERIYDLSVVNAVLGGNMSSRLFQKVREECGLAYSVYSYPNFYQNNGSMVIYAGLNSESLCEALALIGNEIRILKRDKLSKTEVETTKEQLKASVIMGLEGMSSRMSSFGKSLLFENEVRDMEEMIKLIDRVNSETVAETIDRIFDTKSLNIAVLGKTEKSEDEISDSIEF